MRPIIRDYLGLLGLIGLGRGSICLGVMAYMIMLGRMHAMGANMAACCFSGLNKYQYDGPIF